MAKGWIGVDLDRTTAHYSSGMWPAIGEPIPDMVQRIKNWLADGWEVRIVTARVDDVLLYRLEHYNEYDGDIERDANQRIAVLDWCAEHIGQRLKVTNRKDFDMVALIDDRAYHANPNTGEIVGGEPKLD